MLQSGIKQLNAGQWAEAESTLLSLLAEEPSHVQALRLLGYLANQTGQFERAVEYLNRAILAHPDEIEAYLDLANGLYALARLDQAEGCLRQALVYNPN